jgi:hypothetical protein
VAVVSTLREDLEKKVGTLDREIGLRHGWLEIERKDRKEWKAYIVRAEAKLREIRACLAILPPPPPEKEEG